MFFSSNYMYIFKFYQNVFSTFSLHRHFADKVSFFFSAVSRYDWQIKNLLGLYNMTFKGL